MLNACRIRSLPVWAIVGLFATGMGMFAQARLKRGEAVHVADIKKPAILKIVGLPDEIVEANDTGVYVDDVAVTGFSKEFLTRHRLARQYIPMDHYFVMGEERPGKDVKDVKDVKEISEHLGIHPADRIERAQ
jgi:hypothetical protein